MDPTHVSLIDQAKTGTAGAWNRLVGLYQPFVFNWLRGQSVQHHTAEELTQDVLVVVFKELPGFNHAGHPGAFRTWLRLITSHKAQAFWKANRLRATGQGGAEVQGLIEQLADPASALSAIWDRDHDEHVLRRLLEDVSPEFSPTTLEAFRLQALEGVSAEETARRLGLTVGAAYVARSRVLRRLREVAGDLIG